MKIKNNPYFGWMMSGLVLLAIIVSSSTNHEIIPNVNSTNNAELMPEKVLDEPCVGEVRMFAGNFAPRGYAFCNGQLLPIAENTALFSILGTIYGGDGRTTFGLPNLEGRMAVHKGSGPGLTSWALGQNRGGYQSAVSISGSGSVEVGPPGRSGNSNTVTAVSLGQAAVENSQPYQVINYIIALQGLYCSRD